MADVTRAWQAMSVADALDALGVAAATGLDDAEVDRRRLQVGPNIIEAAAGSGAWRLLLRQFTDPIIWVLLVAAGLSWSLGDYRGATILLAIIVINAVIGAVQEYRAERTLELLATLLHGRTTVLRAGALREIDEIELVPGDIVALEAGDRVPADMRLIETAGLATDDHLLTGESLPQDKDAACVCVADASFDAVDNMAFSGTAVTRGSGRGVVVAIGMSTAIGDLADASQRIERDRSPLQQELEALARTLTRLAACIALGLFAANLLVGIGSEDDFMLLLQTSALIGIGVAAACVPQGLPAQISVALSLGVARLARKNALVKRLSAIETLGATTVICSDKTGTITTNALTIVECRTLEERFEVSGEGYALAGAIELGGRPLRSADRARLAGLFSCGLLAGRGRVHAPDEQHNTWYALGDPTEAAFMPLAVKAGLDADRLETEYPLLHELPFDGTRRRMTVVRVDGSAARVWMKGAPEQVLDCCTQVATRSGWRPIDAAVRTALADAVQELSARALRVIALATRPIGDANAALESEALESGLTWLGVVAMADLPRPGVAAAVRAVGEAGVRLFMITGDDPTTARAIADRIGMPEGPVLTAAEFHALDASAAAAVLREHSVVFSRVAPRDKFQLVSVLGRMGEVVTVTGDGVNDTLSLKRAATGVAMGGIGSDIAKEAAEVVLLDDNFSSLVTAIREGRLIFQNLRHIIISSITSNLGELSCVCLGFAGAAAGLPLPLTAVQILAVDLMAEMLPLMALTLDPAAPALMHQPPRPLHAHIVNRRSLGALLGYGALMGTAAYASFYVVHAGGGELGAAQAAAYLTIALIQYVNILSNRTSGSLFGASLRANPALAWAITASAVLIVFVVQVPALGTWLGFAPLRAVDWVMPLAGATLFCAVREALKASCRTADRAGRGAR